VATFEAVPERKITCSECGRKWTEPAIRVRKFSNRGGYSANAEALEEARRKPAICPSCGHEN